MPCALLIHWNCEEAKARAAAIESAGYEVRQVLKPWPLFLRQARTEAPAVIVIDLSRLPSHGRDIALALRRHAATRRIPIVFVEGDPEKLERIRKLLPDAVYTTYGRIRRSLRQAIEHPPADPVAPASVFAAYAGTPLVKKLGIKQHSAIVLVNAPRDFVTTLGALPEGVELCQRAGPRTSLILWFVTSRSDLERDIRRMARAGESQPMWIIWPKKASGLASDLTQQIVRDAGLAAGLVDYKICSVDATWSGLLFRRRK